MSETARSASTIPFVHTLRARPWALVLSLLTGCPDDEAASCEPVSLSALTPTEFCAALERALIHSSQSCWGGAEADWATFGAGPRASCERSALAVQAGNAVYTATIAAACLGDGCRAVSCEGVFRSKRHIPEAEACFDPANDTGTSPFSRLGNPCSPGLYCGQNELGYRCQRQARTGESCAPIGVSCFDGLECLGPEPVTCQPVVEVGVGAVCDEHARCAIGSACVSERCVALLPLGAACSPDADRCSAGTYCDSGSNACSDVRRCGQKTAIGEDCEAGECNLGGYCSADLSCRVRPVTGQSCAQESGESDLPKCFGEGCGPNKLCK